MSDIEPTPEVPAVPETKGWWQRLKTFEPALLRAILTALAVVLGTVGLDATGVFEKINVAWAALFGLIPLIQAWWTRGTVTPNSKVVEQVETDGTVKAGVASPLPTGQVIKRV